MMNDAPATATPHRGKQFVNPYTFVPAPARDSLNTDRNADGYGDSGTDGPPSHARIVTSPKTSSHRQWSGTLTLTLTCRTPLLIPDTTTVVRSPESDKKPNGPAQVYPITVDDDGLPVIAPTSLKGSLRSAFETITASRFGVFDAHVEPVIDSSSEQSDRQRQNSNGHQAPASLLPESVRPAKNLSELSPAERLFGWAPTEGQETGSTSSGYRGRIAIGPIRCLTPDWEKRFPGRGGLPLNPLSSPKPKQFRFYSAASPDGEPVADGTAPRNAYTRGSGLRGRKMYRWSSNSHRWDLSKRDAANEYRAAPKDDQKKDTQTVAYRSWIKPGTTFQVTIRLDGAPEPEVAALIWLLRQAGRRDGHPHTPLRLGAAKPFGFGVVEATITSHELRNGQESADRWRTLSLSSTPNDHHLQDLEHTFTQTLEAQPLLRQAANRYLRAAAAIGADGQELPLHYPRIQESYQREGFKWFSANNKGAQLALPSIDSPPGLPYNPSQQNRSSRGSRPQSRRKGPH